VTFFKIALICSKKSIHEVIPKMCFALLIECFHWNPTQRQILYPINIALTSTTWNASLVVCPHGCASAYALKQAFAQCKIFLDGTVPTYWSKQNKYCFTNNASDSAAIFESFVRFSKVPTVYSSKCRSSIPRAWIVVHCSVRYR